VVKMSQLNNTYCSVSMFQFMLQSCWWWNIDYNHNHYYCY